MFKIFQHFSCKQCKNIFDVEEITENYINKSNNNNNALINPNANYNLRSFGTKAFSFLRNKKSKKIEQLSSLVLYVNKDSLFSSFFDQNGQVNYDLIIKKFLMPYFKMKSRILKKGSFFKIGEIDFKVSGLYPGKKGVITSKTFIHCDSYFSSNTILKRALFLTTQKYDNFNQEALVSEFLDSRSNFLINKNEITQIKQYEFYVRNCEPESGRINSETQITVENKEIYNITKLKIAIIKVIFNFIYFYTMSQADAKNFNC